MGKRAENRKIIDKISYTRDWLLSLEFSNSNLFFGLEIWGPMLRIYVFDSQWCI